MTKQHADRLRINVSNRSSVLTFQSSDHGDRSTRSIVILYPRAVGSRRRLVNNYCARSPEVVIRINTRNTHEIAGGIVHYSSGFQSFFYCTSKQKSYLLIYPHQTTY